METAGGILASDLASTSDVIGSAQNSLPRNARETRERIMLYREVHIVCTACNPEDWEENLICPSLQHFYFCIHLKIVPFSYSTSYFESIIIHDSIFLKRKKQYLEVQGIDKNSGNLLRRFLRIEQC